MLPKYAEEMTQCSLAFGIWLCRPFESNLVNTQIGRVLFSCYISMDQSAGSKKLNNIMQSNLRKKVKLSFSFLFVYKEVYIDMIKVFNQEHWEFSKNRIVFSNCMDVY